DGHLHLMNLATREHHRIDKLELRANASVSWLADSSAFALETGTGKAYQLSRAGAVLREIPSVRAARIYAPDSPEYAYASRGAIHVERDGTAIRQIPLDAESSYVLLQDWSRDGEWLLATSYTKTTSTLWNIRRDGGERIRLATWMDQTIRGP